MNKHAALTILVLLTCACSRQQQDRAPSREASSIEPRSQPPAAARRPTVDPKSREAAEDLVRAFAGLLNNGRIEEAYMLLGPGAGPRQDFETAFHGLHDVRVTVRSATEPEGAAGSIYTSVPLNLSGTRNGHAISRTGRAVLRRVNDVPGSTEAQRHWHIERIEWER